MFFFSNRAVGGRGMYTVCLCAGRYFSVHSFAMAGSCARLPVLDKASTHSPQAPSPLLYETRHGYVSPTNTNSFARATDNVPKVGPAAVAIAVDGKSRIHENFLCLCAWGGRGGPRVPWDMRYPIPLDLSHSGYSAQATLQTRLHPDNSLGVHVHVHILLYNAVYVLYMYEFRRWPLRGCRATPGYLQT